MEKIAIALFVLSLVPSGKIVFGHALGLSAGTHKTRRHSKTGKVICPRCGHLDDGDHVKRIDRPREGGLKSQLYAVCLKCR